MRKRLYYRFLLLLFTTSVVFATGKDHFVFSSQPIVLGIGTDLIFANGFEDNTPVGVVYTSDNISPITDIPAVEVGSELVGSVAGSFQTDQMGQANYSIPILTGAGTAGLAPQMSLNYSSGSGNGVVGVGWSLSGTTVITRCRETEESRDGASSITPQPITWDNNDKLCLNGERLYLVGGANYWDDGSTYRTERDQFARLTYLATTDSFTIERKDGSIAYYGDTTDSAIAATDVAGTPVYAWAISRFKDNMNNYIDYTYQKLDNLEFVLLHVDYTGHIGNGTAGDPSHATYNNLSFTYENTRTDQTIAYIAGAKVAMTQRLASIDSFIDGTNIRTYTLNYANSSHSGRSIMTSLSECRAASCLPVMTFDWSQPASTFKTTSVASVSFPTGISSSKLGDINGDSRADLIFVDAASVFKVAKANGETGFATTLATSIAAPPGTSINNKWHLLDYNADGRMDLMVTGTTNWMIHLSNGSGFASTGINTNISVTDNNDFQIVDINGDGLGDMLYETSSNTLAVRYLQKDGTGAFSFAPTALTLSLPILPSAFAEITPPTIGLNYMQYRFSTRNTLNVRTHDINGDGVADLILKSEVVNETINPNPQNQYQFVSTDPMQAQVAAASQTIDSSHWIAFVNTGLDSNGDIDFSSEYYYLKEIVSSSDNLIQVADINADGMSDILTYGAPDWNYRLATGMGFMPPALIVTVNNVDSMSNPINYHKNTDLVDCNGDGMLDFIFPTQFSNDPYFCRIWNGDGYSSNISTDAHAVNIDTNTNFFLDVNGDGRADHFRIDASGNQNIYGRLDPYVAIDKITRMVNGLGATTSIDYRPLTFSDTYVQGVGANALDFGNHSPVFDYLSSLYVVRSVTTDTPTQGDATATTQMQYQYKNARVQSGGRGFLGFEEIITSIPVKSTTQGQDYLLQTETTYRQDYPYIGLPESVTVTQYEVAPTLPNPCTTDDCFPPPCDPGVSCNSALNSTVGTTATPVLLSQTNNTFAKMTTAGKSQFAYIDSTIEKNYAPNGTGLLKTRVQTTTHDGFGNPLVNTVKIYDGVYDDANPNTNLLHTTTTTNQYTNDETDWKIGLLTSSSTNVTRPLQAGVTTLIEYDYDLSTGLLKEERKNPSTAAIDADKYLRIQHKYDRFGNETKSISCSGHDFTSTECTNTSTISSDIPDGTNKTLIHRYNELIFDAKGRYANTVKNSLNQTVSSITSRDIYGNPITTTDLLGTSTTNSYDVFGTAQSSYSSLGSWTYTSKKWCSELTGTSADSSCPANAKIRITNRASGGALSYGFMDKLGRTISTTARSFNAIDDASTPNPDERWIINDQYFDNLGRAVTTVGPYFYGEANIPTTSTQYDRYNRVTKVILPDGATETIAYVGFVTTTTNALNQSKTETKNALGELIQAKDHLNNTLDYTYNAQGLVTEIHRSADGITELLTKNTYDKLGRKTQSEDVDTGTTTSDYNAEGEIIRVTDAKGQYAESYRDELGRVDLTENFDSNGIKKLSTQQNYNATSNQIESEVEFLGADAFRRDYVYDNLKRLSSITTGFTDTQNVCNNGGDCTYTNSIYYDQYSRSKIEQDVSGKAIKNNYNAQGYLERITNAENESQQYYKINTTDNRDNITQDTKAANISTYYSFDKDRGFMTDIINNSLSKNIWYNYSYDVLGNLKKRADIKDQTNNIGLSECFYYDGLNRMTATRRYANFGINCSTQPTGTTEITAIAYNDKGNITQKDGQNYSYLTASSTNIGNSPHQVQSKGNQVFTYDANGNNIAMTNFQNKNGTFQTRHLQYNTFNKIQRMWTGNDSNNPIAEAIYKYDTTRQKYARIDNEGATTKVTYFIGNVEIEYNGGQVKYKRQLGNYAIITEQGTTTTEAYLLTDHLGSVDTIFDATGTILQQMSFSAWGERRLPVDWNTITLPTIRQQMDDYTNRGFTGHEMVDAFGIINMGGRIYDPSLGRVLQADPFVQDPTNTQSFNRYTYVFNNPLSYTDPSGYFSWKKFFKIGIAIIAAAFTAGWAGGLIAESLGFGSLSAAITGAGATLQSALIAGAVTGATAAFVSVAIITGNLKLALKAGFSGAVLGAAFAGISYGISSLAWFDASHVQFNLNSNVELSIPQRISKVLAQATTSGLASEIKGDGFNQGFRYSLVTVALGEVAQFARYRASISSAKNPLNIQGKSGGFQGDGLKIGGGRQRGIDCNYGSSPISCSTEDLVKQSKSPLGGTQGLEGQIFGARYKPGGFNDFVVETYAGPHDQLNSWYWYDQFGNNKVFPKSSLANIFGQTLNAVDVFVATPLAISSLVQVYNPAITLYVRELGYE